MQPCTGSLLSSSSSCLGSAHAHTAGLHGAQSKAAGCGGIVRGASSGL